MTCCKRPFSSSAAAQCRCKKDLDSPWSWLVCFCATLIIVLTLGISLNFGVLFPVLMDYFQESRERIGKYRLLMIQHILPDSSEIVKRTRGTNFCQFAGASLFNQGRQIHFSKINWPETVCISNFPFIHVGLGLTLSPTTGIFLGIYRWL